MLATSLAAALKTLHPPPLPREDAEAILAIAQLVVDIDGKEGADEIKMFFSIGNLLFELAGEPNTDVPTFASDEDDESRMFELATQLKSQPARELAYAVSRLLAASDLDVAPVEDEFLDRLRGILGVDRARAAALDALLREAT